MPAASPMLVLDGLYLGVSEGEAEAVGEVGLADALVVGDGVELLVTGLDVLSLAVTDDTGDRESDGTAGMEVVAEFETVDEGGSEGYSAHHLVSAYRWSRTYYCSALPPIDQRSSHLHPCIPAMRIHERRAPMCTCKGR